MRKTKINIMALVLSACMLFSACGHSDQKTDVTVSDGEIISSMLLGITDKELPPDEDLDGDGLTNGRETEFGTNPQSSDTDRDSLSDLQEVDEYSTDPVRADTDKDGVKDGLEIALGMNPLKKKSDGKTKDADRKFSRDFDYDGVSLHVDGRSNAMDVYVENVDLINFGKTAGVYSPLYELYNNNEKFSSAKLTISYDEDAVSGRGSDERDLAVFQLLEDGTFEKVGGRVNEDENTISVDLKHFSCYFIGDKKIVEQKQETDVYLLIDNSGSMYPEEMVKDSLESDVDFKRVDMAKKLVSMTDDSVHYAAAKFTADFMPLVPEFSDNKEEIYEKLDLIRTESEYFNGTYIATSIIESVKCFDKDSLNRKFVIILTDGETTEGSLFSTAWQDEDDAIDEANERNVSVIVVGLGSGVDADYLNKIASSTGGYYVYANDADALDKIYSTLMSAMTYGFADLDGDGTNDHILIADSGFDIEKNAWGFRNYLFRPAYEDEIHGGQCAGMAAVAQIWYKYHHIPGHGDRVDSYRASGVIKNDYLQSDGYDISGTDIMSDSSMDLRDIYIFKDLDYALSQDAGSVYQRDPKDSSHIMYSDEINEMIKKHPDLIEIRTENIGEAETWGYDNKKYTAYDTIVYNLRNVDRGSLSDEDKHAYDILQMINWYYSIQGKEEYFTETDISDDSLEKDVREKNFSSVVEKINNGTPMLVSGCGHVVNAVRIYRSIDDPYKYDLVVYDNNSPDRERLLTIEKYAPSGIEYLDITSRFNDYDYRIIDTDGVFGPAGKTIYAVFKEYTGKH